MHCPEDFNYLIPREDIYSGKITYECPHCQGKLVDFETAGVKDFSRQNSISRRESGQPLTCPRDHELLFEDSTGNYLCQLCFSSWVRKEAPSSIPESKHARRLAATVVGLFAVALVLFGWQLGEYISKADPLSQLVISPIKEAAIIVWFLIFLFIFLIPATIYEQMVLSHRPHFRKAAHHPLVRWLPAIIIVLMAINIYFLSP